MVKISLPVFPVEGGCLCGAVRYEVTAAPFGVYRCHCKDCQRLSSGPFALSMPMRAADFRLTKGTTVFYEKTADSGRKVHLHACGICGTKLYNEPLSAPEIVILKPGTLDDIGWARPVGNIWTASAVAWAEIDRDDINFERQPPSREPLYAAWAAEHLG
ncbi:MAG TPA: GFA family protein [Devosiaceae bacterium]|jgi:hypothetical protein